jgi:hypothetical protein
MKTKFSFHSILAGIVLAAISFVAFGSASGQQNPIGPDSTTTARIQVIHNSADAAAAVVDVWVNSTKLIPNFSFRTASPFIDAPAGVLLNISIAPPNSTSWTQALYVKQVVLTANQTYIAVANGIVSTSGYTPSPTFNLDVYPMGREAASQSGNTDILVMHGSTDAPVVDIKAGNVTLVDNLAYGSFDGYLEVPTAELVIDIADQSGATVLLQYSAPLATLGLQGAALAVVASGFLDPTNNSNSNNTFGLWVALPSGGNMIPLPLFTQSVGEVTEPFGNIRLFPNPASEKLNIELQMNEPSVMVEIFDATGRVALRKTMEGSGLATSMVDIGMLNPGIYLVSMSSANHRHTQKLLINR